MTHNFDDVRPAIIAAVHDFNRFANAATPIGAADALVALSNSMSDLASWVADDIEVDQ